jgi:hypothetical protein
MLRHKQQGWNQGLGKSLRASVSRESLTFGIKPRHARSKTRVSPAGTDVGSRGVRVPSERLEEPSPTTDG